MSLAGPLLSSGLLFHGNHELTSSSVQGVNLLEPGSAPKVIKTWDDRLLEEGVESGVDDEVS